MGSSSRALEKYLIFVCVTELLSPRLKKSTAFSPWTGSVDSKWNIRKQTTFFCMPKPCCVIFNHSIFRLNNRKNFELQFYVFSPCWKSSFTFHCQRIIRNTYPYRFLDISSLIMYFTKSFKLRRMHMNKNDLMSA